MPNNIADEHIKKRLMHVKLFVSFEVYGHRADGITSNSVDYVNIWRNIFILKADTL